MINPDTKSTMAIMQNGNFVLMSVKPATSEKSVDSGFNLV
jgi:hypothetical protein